MGRWRCVKCGWWEVRTASMIDQRWKRPSSSSDHGETCGSEIRRYPPSGSTSACEPSSCSSNDASPPTSSRPSGSSPPWRRSAVSPVAISPHPPKVTPPNVSPPRFRRGDSSPIPGSSAAAAPPIVSAEVTSDSGRPSAPPGFSSSSSSSEPRPPPQIPPSAAPSPPKRLPERAAFFDCFEVPRSSKSFFSVLELASKAFSSFFLGGGPPLGIAGRDSRTMLLHFPSSSSAKSRRKSSEV